MIDLARITPESLRQQGSAKWTTFPDTLGAWVAEEDFPVARPIVEALHQAVDIERFGYVPPTLKADIIAAIHDWYATSIGWDFDPAHIRIIGDVLKGLEATMRLLAPEGKIIVPTPGYMPFFTLPGVFDRELLQVPMVLKDADWRLDLAALDTAFAAGGHILILCNPHNPVGHVYSADELLAISEVVARHDGRVFVDEIHAPLVYGDVPHTSYASLNETTARQAITAFSPSKAWNTPGLKTAAVILSNADDRKLWRQKARWFSEDPSTLGMVASIAALRDGDAWRREVCGIVRDNARLLGDLVSQYVPEAHYLAPTGTYLAWIDLRPYALGDHPAQLLKDEAHVIVTDGALCGELGVGHIRINLATTPVILTEIMRRVGETVARHR